MFPCLEPAALLVTEGAQNITESVCVPRNKIPKNPSVTSTWQYPKMWLRNMTVMTEQTPVCETAIWDSHSSVNNSILS